MPQVVCFFKTSRKFWKTRGRKDIENGEISFLSFCLFRYLLSRTISYKKVSKLLSSGPSSRFFFMTNSSDTELIYEAWLIFWCIWNVWIYFALLKGPGHVTVNKRCVRDSLRVWEILFTNRCVLQNGGPWNVGLAYLSCPLNQVRSDKLLGLNWFLIFH